VLFDDAVEPATHLRHSANKIALAMNFKLAKVAERIGTARWAQSASESHPLCKARQLLEAVGSQARRLPTPASSTAVLQVGLLFSSATV
jgi:hypothetical protein